MNLLMLDLVDRFYALIWPLLRISAFMGFASIFSVRAVNLRLRILISFGLTVFIAMQIDIPKLDPVTVLGLKEIFNQIFIGFSMAMVMQLATAALVIAGQALSGSMGLTMANLIDPTLGNVPVLSQFFTLLGTLVFLAIGGHLIVFGILLESFQQFPIGQSLMTQDFMGKMISWSAMMFVASLLIGMVQTLAVAIDQSMLTVMSAWGMKPTPQHWAYPVLELKLSQVAPILPYLMLVLTIIFRPRGLMGTREE